MHGVSWLFNVKACVGSVNWLWPNSLLHPSKCRFEGQLHHNVQRNETKVEPMFEDTGWNSKKKKIVHQDFSHCGQTSQTILNHRPQSY